MAAPMSHARIALRLINLSTKSRFVIRQQKPVFGLFRQINRCLADEASKGDETPNKPEIELSHPKDKRKLEQTSDSSSSSSSSSSSDNSSSDSGNESDSSSSGSDSDLDSEVVSAVGEVAKALGGDTNKTASDLLSQLKSHADLTAGRREGGEERPDMSQLFEGMRIQKSWRPQNQQPARGTGQRGRLGGRAGGPPRTEGRPGRDDQDGVLAQLQGETGGQQMRQGQQRPRQRRGQEVNLKIFDGKGLGIFEKAADIGAVTEVPPPMSLFDRLQREEMSRQTTLPPENAAEEQIRWTKEGILWKFPIDNEQGMEEEAKVGFHEHIFLEPLLADFPTKGPLRHFMELVCVGLSKNPYVTVAEKRQHIAWFKTYFAEKKHILDEVIVDPSSATPELQPKAPES